MSNYYLILEPTVFINIQGDEILFYHSESGNKLYFNDGLITKIIIRNRENHLHVFPIESSELNQPNIQKFFQDIEYASMGSLEPINRIPIQFAPSLKIQQHPAFDKKEKNNKDNSHTDEYFAYVLNLKILSVYLNDSSTEKPLLAKNISHQVLSNIYDNTCTEIEFKKLSEIIDKLLFLKTLYKLNLLGGNILSYSYLDELLDYLRPYSSSSDICFYLNLEDIKNNVHQLNKVLQLENISTIFCLSATNVKNNINDILQYIPEEKLEINCLVEKPTDIDAFDTVFSNQSIKHTLYPIYNGKNDDLFKENIFITQSDIDSTFLDMNQVFKNQTLNSFYFGHLIILPNGNVHTNLNTKKVGNLFQDTLAKIVYKSLHNKTSDWFLLRSKIAPCNQCIYNFLCPPPSNYEFVLNRNNLCHIFVEK